MQVLAKKRCNESSNQNTRLQLFTAHGNHLLRPAPTTYTDIFDPSAAFCHNTSIGHGYLSPPLLAHRMHDTQRILQHFIVIIDVSTAHECKLGFISKAMYCPVRIMSCIPTNAARNPILPTNVRHLQLLRGRLSSSLES